MRKERITFTRVGVLVEPKDAAPFWFDGTPNELLLMLQSFAPEAIENAQFFVNGRELSAVDGRTRI